MFKRALVLVALLTLGCSGMTESLVEITTGGEMEISENGDVVMTLPDGSKVETRNGVQPPEDFPVPPPWEGASCQTLVTMTNPDGKQSTIATYEMERPRAEIAKTYEVWLNENATGVEHTKEDAAGMVNEVLVGSVGEGAVAITLTEAFGANSVSIVWAPDGKDALPR